MRKKLTDIINKKFNFLAFRIGFLVYFSGLFCCFFVLKIWLSYTELQLLMSNQKLLSQFILSGDQTNLDFLMSSLAKTQNWTEALVYDLNNVILSSYPETSKRGKNLAQQCEMTFAITRDLTVDGYICWNKSFARVEYLILIAIAFILTLVFIFQYIIQNKIKNIIENHSNRLSKLSEAILKEIEIDNTIKIETYEEENLFEGISNNLKNLKKLQETESLLKTQEAISLLARQVAHDIRSPLAALNTIATSIENLSNEKTQILKHSIQRVNDIANDLLNRSLNLKNAHELNKNCELETRLLFPIVDSIISEKRIQFNYKINIELVFFSSNEFSLFGKIHEIELKRIISNLINNSFEAIGTRKGVIKINLFSTGDSLQIDIEDDGPGIEESIINRLGHEEISFGKNTSESGSGLGIFHAKSALEKMNGKLSISSFAGFGTKISLLLPNCNKPKWFLDKLLVKNNSVVLICDDDYSIHTLWKDKFINFKNIRVSFFSSLAELSESVDFLKLQNQEFTLLIDFEFSNNKSSGIDFIILNKLEDSSILVTSHFEEPNIIKACNLRNIKIIPKYICSLIPLIILEETDVQSIYYDIILLDNEKLQEMVWSLAAKEKNKSFKYFSCSSELFYSLKLISFSSTFYIDSDLGENIRGEEVAAKIYDLGFKNIFLCTGSDPVLFKDLPFLKGVIDKNPVF